MQFLQQIQCMERLRNIRIVRRKLLRLQQLRSAMAEVSGAAINQSKIFMQYRECAAGLTDAQPLFELRNRLWPIMCIGRRQCEVTKRGGAVRDMFIGLQLFKPNFEALSLFRI